LAGVPVIRPLGTDRVRNTVSNSSSIVACGFVEVGTFLFRSRCLVTGSHDEAQDSRDLNLVPPEFEAAFLTTDHNVRCSKSNMATQGVLGILMNIRSSKLHVHNAALVFRSLPPEEAPDQTGNSVFITVVFVSSWNFENSVLSPADLIPVSPRWMPASCVDG
jgi:hypothetical protein